MKESVEGLKDEVVAGAADVLVVVLLLDVVVVVPLTVVVLLLEIVLLVVLDEVGAVAVLRLLVKEVVGAVKELMIFRTAMGDSHFDRWFFGLGPLGTEADRWL